jgi:phenylalanyl-tRNA synthetase beta subunit
VARLYGYDNVPARTLKADGVPVPDHPNFILANKVREHLVAEGYTELYGYTFTDHGDVTIEKPLASDKAWLRTNLKESMQRAIEFNLQHTLFDKDEVKLFEIGTVFRGDNEQVNVVVGAGRKKPKLKIDVTEYELADMAGQLDETPPNLDPYIKNDVHYQPVSAYPRIIRDIAVWVPAATTVESVADLIRSAAGELLVEGPVLFDQFEKGERQSLAFRLVLQSATKTLVDDDASLVMEEVVAVLEKQPNFEVRK